MTPLHLASYSGNENVVRLLLNSAGVQVEAATTENVLTKIYVLYKFSAFMIMQCTVNYWGLWNKWLGDSWSIVPVLIMWAFWCSEVSLNGGQKILLSRWISYNSVWELLNNFQLYIHFYITSFRWFFISWKIYITLNNMSIQNVEVVMTWSFSCHYTNIWHVWLTEIRKWLTEIWKFE